MSIYQTFSAEYEVTPGHTPLAKQDFSHEMDNFSYRPKEEIGVTMLDSVTPPPFIADSSFRNTKYGRGKIETKVNAPTMQQESSNWLTAKMTDIMSRKDYDKGYICKVCNLCLNGHEAVQPVNRHRFIPGVYRKLLPFEYGPWAPFPNGGPLIN